MAAIDRPSLGEECQGILDEFRRPARLWLNEHILRLLHVGAEERDGMGFGLGVVDPANRVADFDIEAVRQELRHPGLALAHSRGDLPEGGAVVAWCSCGLGVLGDFRLPLLDQRRPLLISLPRGFLLADLLCSLGSVAVRQWCDVPQPTWAVEHRLSADAPAGA